MRMSMRLWLVGLTAVLACGGLMVAYGQNAPTTPATSTAPATAPSLRQLQEERLKCAEAVLQVAKAKLDAGNGTSAEWSVALRLVAECQLDMAETKAQRVAILQVQVAVCEAQAKDTQARVSAGRVSSMELAYTNYDLAESRVRLAKLQAEP